MIAYTVSLRTREIGLRMAMGAKQSDVMKMVLKKGLRVTLVGVAIGLLASIGLTRLVRSQLYQVSPTDPVVYLAVSLLLVSVSLLACYVPARRAAYPGAFASGPRRGRRRRSAHGRARPSHSRGRRGSAAAGPRPS